MKKLFQLSFIFITIISFTLTIHSCKPSSNETELMGISPCSSCDDLDCWQNATKEGSKKAFKCTTDALSKVAKSTIKYANLIGDLSDIVATFYSIAVTVSKSLVNQNLDSLVPIYGDSTLKIDPKELTSVLKAITAELIGLTKNPGLICSAEALNEVVIVWKYVNEMISLFNSYAQSSHTAVSRADFINGMLAIGKNATLLISNSTALEKNVEKYQSNKKLAKDSSSVLGGISACFKSISKQNPDNIYLKFLEPIGSSLGTIASYLSILVVLVECGYNLSAAGVTLLANTQCMIDDLAKLSVPNKAEEYLLKNPQCSATKSCAINIMHVHGKYSKDAYELRGKMYSSPGLLSYLPASASHMFHVTQHLEEYPKFCYNACVNKETRISQCEDTVNQLYKNKSYYDDCIKNCNNTTCEPAIDACISSCCGSNEKCRTSVHEMKNK